MRPLIPVFEGGIDVERVPEEFIERVAARVNDGLFIPGSRRRANYVVTGYTRDELRFAAADFWTAFNVGLNDVMVRQEGPTRIAYRVTYWRWTRYAVFLCGSIAVFALAGLVFALPWISPAQRQTMANPVFATVFGANLAFWGFVWPWVLVAIHKKPAARCLERILRDALAPLSGDGST